MRRLTFFTLATLISTTVALAGPGEDPTFNGTINGADCYVRTMTMCGDTYCQQVLGPCIGDHCGTLHVGVAGRNYSFSSGEQRLEILEASKPEIGKPLWLKFKVDLRGETGSMMISLIPSPGGGYTTTAVALFHLERPNGAKGIAIETFECERYSSTE